MWLIAHGYANKEIAPRLGLSVKTVETYKARALEKLGHKTRVGLVRYAIDRGWMVPAVPQSARTTGSGRGRPGAGGPGGAARRPPRRRPDGGGPPRERPPAGRGGGAAVLAASGVPAGDRLARSLGATLTELMGEDGLRRQAPSHDGRRRIGGKARTSRGSPEAALRRPGVDTGSGSFPTPVPPDPS